MAQDPSLVTGDGPKTPLSPRTRSGTLKVDRGKKIGHRRVGEGGEVTYKKVCIHFLLKKCNICLLKVLFFYLIFTSVDSYNTNYGVNSVRNKSCCWWFSF